MRRKGRGESGFFRRGRDRNEFRGLRPERGGSCIRDLEIIALLGSQRHGIPVIHHIGRERFLGCGGGAGVRLDGVGNLVGPIERIRGVDAAPHLGRTLPDGCSLPTQAGIQLAGHGLEGYDILAGGIDFQELQGDFVATGILAQCLPQDLFGLGIPTIGHVDLGFGDGVNLMGVDRAQPQAAEVGQQHAAFGAGAGG